MWGISVPIVIITSTFNINPGFALQMELLSEHTVIILNYTYKTYNLTVHFIKNTCTIGHLCSYIISQARGSRTVHKIMQVQAKNFS